jgi:uncharacterized protein YdaU (DUF1376 family)
MNYYEHHIGDYDAATAHLTWVQDMAYARLLRLYYRRESPIPADTAEACRLIRAQTKDQKQAVETVLREFFTLTDDGWHQARCDAEIEAYQIRAAHNQRVGKLGGRPKKIKTQTEPEQNPSGYSEENPPGYFREPERNPPQSPVPRPQSPIQLASLASRASPGEACKAIREAGIANANPGNETLRTLLAQGITVEELRAAASIAVASAEDGSKAFAYALKVAQTERAKAGKVRLAEPSAWAKLSTEVAGRPSVLDMTPEEREAAYGPDAARG